MTRRRATAPERYATFAEITLDGGRQMISNPAYFDSLKEAEESARQHGRAYGTYDASREPHFMTIGRFPPK
jgi:hypothetical protein